MPVRRVPEGPAADVIRRTSAELRHAYANLKNGHVRHHATFADGLIAPQIKQLEDLVQGPLDGPAADAIRRISAELRHAYANLKNGQVLDHAAFADGLIAPQIGKLEDLAQGPRDGIDETDSPSAPKPF
ncbi:hypothetical protein BHAOGJBA_1224 [Methylobacterium hispanicum]|uniref:Uncharacterized protein n=1 Tax=Methylobacterium hispanicum TaxID=270350 RepID=A0AAV4ZIJ8_9HYPH|nr:hypothetical protein [Methylobacterium hispanicum]GJD87719.1 hypothetical protein BHAOGJBA_1224 [Methylobacterium hispanicum]